jgi:hypothetical protein
MSVSYKPFKDSESASILSGDCTNKKIWKKGTEMKKSWLIIQAGGSLLAGLLLMGCVDRSYKMIGKECPQVFKYEPPYGTIKNYLHSITLYEGYETRAHFDVLCMSERMRAIYAALKSSRVGNDEARHEALLKQQYAQHAERMTLYVLVQIADSNFVSLSDKNSTWSLFITTASGQRLKPLAIKEIELDPEVKTLFGHRYIAFKKSYKVDFPVVDVSGKPYIKENELCQLSLAGPGMSGAIQWIPNKKDVFESDQLLIQQGENSLWEEMSKVAAPKERDEDYYW